MFDFLREIRYGCRRLFADRLTTTVAILSLALGLGSYVFAARLLEGLFWASPPGLREPNQLLRVFGRQLDSGPHEWGRSFSYPDFEAFSRAPPSVVSGTAAWVTTSVSVGSGLEAVRASATVVGPRYFSVLGLKPSRGLLDDREPSEDSLYLSDAFWRSHFGGRPDILGSAVSIDGRPLVVRAVLPPGYRGLDPKPVDLWLPFSVLDRLWGVSARTDPQRKYLNLVVRLADEAGVLPAQEALTAISRHRAAEVPGFWATEPAIALTALPAGRAPSPPAEARIANGIAALSLALLLAALVNGAHWLIVRTLDRERDLAVRSALGAPARHLWLGALVELGLATALGLGVGIGVQYLADPSVERLLPLVAHGTDGSASRTTLMTLCGALVTLAACSILPFRWSRRLDLSRTLQRTQSTATRSPHRLRFALPVVQVATATLLVALAATFSASLGRVEREDLGLKIDSVLVASAEFRRVGLSRERGAALLREMESRLRGLPEVSETALVGLVPFEGVVTSDVLLPGREALPELPGGGPFWNAVSPGYFRTMGLSLRAGRFFDERDREDSGPVVIINETLARLGFAGASPLDKCLVLGEPTDPCATIVGVVADSRRQSVREAPAFQVYVPLGTKGDFYGPRALLVRAKGRPEALLGTVRRETQAVHPDMPAVDVRLLRDKVDPQYRPWKLGVAVFGAFGWVALALAFAGLYAVTARGVLERQRESAIRVALGASPHLLTQGVVSRGLRVAALGALLGVVAAAILVRVWGPELVDDLRVEPASLLGAAAITCALAALAAYLPARRFGRIDPAEVLREE
jgi:predicted permease